jgi:hypothetical protein
MIYVESRIYQDEGLENESGSSGAETGGGTIVGVMDIDGGVDAVEEQAQGAAKEGQDHKTVVVHRVGCDRQGCAEQQEQVVEDVDPEERENVTNHACCNKRDEPADLFFVVVVVVVVERKMA